MNKMEESKQLKQRPQIYNFLPTLPALPMVVGFTGLTIVSFLVRNRIKSTWLRRANWACTVASFACASGALIRLRYEKINFEAEPELIQTNILEIYMKYREKFRGADEDKSKKE